jgi:5-methylthioribose kinase
LRETSADDLDIERPEQLLAYLRARGAIQRNEQPEMTTLGGGVSNRVVRVQRNHGEAWVLKQALSKLRVSVDWFSSPKRSHRETLALTWLNELGVNVPRLQFEDDEHHLIAMDAVPEPHENWKVMLLAGRVEMSHVEAFAQMLADMHRKSRTRLVEIERTFGDTSFFESLRIEPYYLYTAEQVEPARQFLINVADDTRANRLCLVHGDYSPKNVLVHKGKLVLLDHEVAHFGDPAFDLGFSTTHLLSKAHHLKQHRARFREAALLYWDVYWNRLGKQPWTEGLEDRAVRSILACLLARVAGRSPLEYLTGAEKDRQRAVTVELMTRPPSEVPALVNAFVDSL